MVWNAEIFLHSTVVITVMTKEINSLPNIKNIFDSKYFNLRQEAWKGSTEILNYY